MGTLHKEFWLSDGSGRTRAERQSGLCRYYLPTLLSDMSVSLESDVVGDVSRAEQAISRLNEEAVSPHSSEGIARLLLRAEAVSSSFIEEPTIGTKRLLKAEMGLEGLGRLDSTMELLKWSEASMRWRPLSSPLKAAARLRWIPFETYTEGFAKVHVSKNTEARFARLGIGSAATRSIL